LEVKKDEEALNEAGASAVLGRSATAFLIAGLQIEDAQCEGPPEYGGKATCHMCNNGLAKLLAHLHTKRHFIAFRNKNLSGQVQASLS
jgi:hypothetical protein